MRPPKKVTLFTFGLLALFTLSVRATERQVLSGHVPAAVAQRHLPPLGSLPATNRLKLVLGLPLRNQVDLTNLIQRIYDPTSANFHHYLTPEQFTARFGPTEADYKTVLDFAKASGLEVTQTSDDRVLVHVTATVGDIEKVFQVRLHTYRHPLEARDFHAPDVEPTVPAGIPLVSISGLNTFFRPHPMSHPHSVHAGRSSAAGIINNPADYPILTGLSFRHAYAPGVTLDGSGQYVGLVALDGFYPGDITNYYNSGDFPAQMNQPLPPPITILTADNFSGLPDANAEDVLEVTSDIEMVISMAPNLAGVYVFEMSDVSPNTSDLLNIMVTKTLIKQFSSSFALDKDQPSEGYLEQMALQGQTFLTASGDGDAFSPAGSIWWPADDPYVTSVGGTALQMDDFNENTNYFDYGFFSQYVAEAVWNSGFQVPAWSGGNGAWTLDGTNGGYWGSGGGISHTYPIPGWQQGVNLTAVGGSATMRNIPDVAMASVYILTVANQLKSGVVEGTSMSAPLWAGFTALVNQQVMGDGKPSLGFMNPALYAIGEGPKYNDCFHNITNGDNIWPGSPNAYSSAPGYNLCTGWGTPKGQDLINGLEWYAGPVYVDFNYTGATNWGTYDFPFKTLTAGAGAVNTNGIIVIKTAGSSRETPTISKPMKITAIGGPASVGN